MTVLTVPMIPRDTDVHGVTATSEFVYRVGFGFNRGFPHRVVVWDNTTRPNTDPVLRQGPCGMRGGPGAYIGPDGRGTDDTVTVWLSAESVSITNSGTNTGTPKSGQVYADVAPLSVSTELDVSGRRYRVIGEGALTPVV